LRRSRIANALRPVSSTAVSGSELVSR
jgi:hypothetical protein